MNCCNNPLEGSSFNESRASVKSICTAWAPRVETAANVRDGFGDQIVDEHLCADSRRSPRAGYSRLSADAEITACLTGTFASRPCAAGDNRPAWVE